ncbi:hypothetical protein F511_38191 [Dorcoceras hygrometricum]|uniref:Uncharacterized protein n=1 Tax=Dorcoceras hygrometricum TaxID=472368 RepID=A0A2Z7AHF6_9LAMI|nr:hypothetical protein F511_38191 [Dorcoceras hygrometricum]
MSIVEQEADNSKRNSEESDVVLNYQQMLLSVLGFDPMSLWGLVVLLPMLFSGNPGFTAGRGFNPAGDAPGGS